MDNYHDNCNSDNNIDNKLDYLEQLILLDSNGTIDVKDRIISVMDSIEQDLTVENQTMTKEQITPTEF